MDSQTSLQQIKDVIRKYCEARDWDQYHNPKDLAIGIITESSELLEHFRFKSNSEMEQMFTNEEKRTQIGEEMADVLYFLLRLAQMYNVDLATEFSKKMAKNELKYPVEKAKGSNKKYNEFWKDYGIFSDANNKH